MDEWVSITNADVRVQLSYTPWCYNDEEQTGRFLCSNQLLSYTNDFHLFDGVGCSVNNIPDCYSVLDYWIKATESKENEKARINLQSNRYTSQGFSNNSQEIFTGLSISNLNNLRWTETPKGLGEG